MHEHDNIHEIDCFVTAYIEQSPKLIVWWWGKSGRHLCPMLWICFLTGPSEREVVRPCEVWTKSINRSARSPLALEKRRSRRRRRSSTSPVVQPRCSSTSPVVPPVEPSCTPQPCSRCPCTPRYQGRSCCSRHDGVCCRCSPRSELHLHHAALSSSDLPSPGALQSPHQSPYSNASPLFFSRHPRWPIGVRWIANADKF